MAAGSGWAGHASESIRKACHIGVSLLRRIETTSERIWYSISVQRKADLHTAPYTPSAGKDHRNDIVVLYCDIVL